MTLHFLELQLRSALVKLRGSLARLLFYEDLHETLPSTLLAF